MDTDSCNLAARTHSLGCVIQPEMMRNLETLVITQGRLTHKGMWLGQKVIPQSFIASKQKVFTFTHEIKYARLLELHF